MKNFQFSIFNFRKPNKGFTLLETTLAVGIFSVIVISSLGIMFGVLNAQIKASNVQAVQDNIRFGMELLTKELRTGSDYQLTVRCTGTPGAEISFITARAEPRTYFLDSATNVIFRATQPLASSFDCNPANGKVSALTSDEVAVESLNFQLHGTTAGPQDGQPRITITSQMSSLGVKFGAETKIDLQATVTQRLRDL